MGNARDFDGIVGVCNVIVRVSDGLCECPIAT